MVIGIDGRSLMGKEPTGVASYGLGLIRSVVAYAPEHEYVVLTTGMSSAEDLCSELPARCRQVHVRVPNKMLHASMTISGRPYVDQLFDQHIDVLFSPNLHFGSVSPDVHHVLTIHDLSFLLFPETYSLDRRVWHRLLNINRLSVGASRIVVPSAHTKADVIAQFGIDEQKIHVVAPQVRTPSAVMPEDIPETFLFFLGTIEPRKNIDGLLDGFSQLPESMQKTYPLIIAGAQGWRCRKLLSRIDRMPNVRYIGYIAPEKKSWLLQHATALVYPSVYEGFGLPVLEAFSSGTPVITSDRSSLPEVAGGGALLVDPRNAAPLARAIEQLLTDRTLRHSLVARGRERAQTYACAHTAQQLTHIITSHGIS